MDASHPRTWSILAPVADITLPVGTVRWTGTSLEYSSFLKLEYLELLINLLDQVCAHVPVHLIGDAIHDYFTHRFEHQMAGCLRAEAIGGTVVLGAEIRALPLVWEIHARNDHFTGKIGRVRWNGGRDLAYELGAQMTELVREHVEPVLASSPDLRGQALHEFFTDVLAELSAGSVWGVAVPDATDEPDEPALQEDALADEPDARDAHHALPASLSPAALLEATRAGQLVWATVAQQGFKAGCIMEGGKPTWLTLSRHGDEYVLTASQGTQPLRQRNSTTRRCELARLYEAIAASLPT